MLCDFKKFELSEEVKVSKKVKKMQEDLAVLQQKIKEKNIPVIIIVDGFCASGKGSMIGSITARMEPRAYKVIAKGKELSEDKRRPFLYNYWLDIPKKGEFCILDKGWYSKAIDDINHKSDEKVDIIKEAIIFERQLVDDGYFIIKFFLNINEDTQKDRLEKLLDNKATAWRVSNDDLKENKHFKKAKEKRNVLLNLTNKPYSKWHIIDSSKKDLSEYQILNILKSEIGNIVDNSVSKTNEVIQEIKTQKIQKLSEVDLLKEVSDEEYKEEYKKEKAKLKKLHSELYLKKVPVVIAFEGWDAAGKGGAIRRLSWSLDSRGCTVSSIAAPTKDELAKHYLYRFWNKLPKDGHIAVFDRSWYGRVMVEKIEGFTEIDRCSMAYKEINEFEKTLADFGTVVLKFFIHIDEKTQLQRFTDRQNDPQKQYKITDEDWRNRQKWQEYETAIDEMLHKTNTEHAPWIIVEGNNKKYARLKVLKTVRKAIEKALEDA